MNKKSNTHIHPYYSERVKVVYNIEYTENDESINSDMSNLKKVECLDLEQMIKYMFQLRQLSRFNINLYTITSIDGQWISEDYANDCEIHTSSETEKRQQKSITILEDTIKEQQNELDLYKTFLDQYNSFKIFEKWKKEGKI